MPIEPPFIVSYDCRTDVLYIAKVKEPAARGIEDSNGIVWRYGAQGQLIGATVMDFFDVWAGKEEALADELSSHFHIAHAMAAGVVRQAMENKGR